MNHILIKQPIDKTISKEQFLEDLDCLFSNLKELYGMYEYFGDVRFVQAREAVERQIEKVYTFDKALSILKQELSFIKDGHFYIGEAKAYEKKYDYAVCHTTYKGIPVIDCKKFYHDSEEELKQLEEFAQSGPSYRDAEELILDFRGNIGGSSTYIYDFLEGLLGQEVGFSGTMLQRSSQLYEAYLKKRHIDWRSEKRETRDEFVCLRTQNKKRIYALIDEETASAAEEGIAVLKNIENVMIVGTHTAGCGSCGNCLSLYMPHSHFKAYFGTGWLIYDEHHNIDAEGGFRGDISWPVFEKWINVRTGLRYAIKEYSKFDEAEILPLYQSVGWVNYTQRKEMLTSAFANSLKTVVIYDETTLIGLIRVIGDGFSM